MISVLTDLRFAALFKGFSGIADQDAIGLGAAPAVNQLLAAQLVDTAPSDLPTLTVVAGLIAATALVGCLVPARRATRIDPLVALRQD